MPELNIALPDELVSWVDEQVAAGAFGTRDAYLRKLIERERDLQRLRALLVEGLESEDSTVADAEFFEELRARARRSKGD
jgi:antitoxin ParD1/3/4